MSPGAVDSYGGCSYQAESCTNSGDGHCAVGFGGTGRLGCGVLAAFHADAKRAIHVFVAGRSSCCGTSGCCADGCAVGGGDAGAPRPAGVEIVPRQLWPPGYEDVVPPKSVTKSVMNLQRDAYARRTTPGLMLITDRRHRTGRDPSAYRRRAGRPVARRAAGFTAVATDLTD